MDSSKAHRRGGSIGSSSRRRTATVLLCSLLFCCALARAALPGVTEIRGATEQISDATLDAWLGERARTADVVAIGETAHGSAAFLRMQARLIRHLVERQGVRLVVWENPVARSLVLSRWADACRAGEAGGAPLDTLYMPTRADRGFFDWMCAFNRRHPRNPIVFRGMDVWDRPWVHYANVRRLGAQLAIDGVRLADIERACPAASATAWTEIEAMLDDVAVAGGFRPREAYLRCRTALDASIDAAKRSGLERQRRGDDSAGDAFELALSASTLQGWLGFYDAFWTDDIGSWNERDAAQGRNLELLMLQHRATRAVLTAHTSHVSHNRSAADWWGYGDLKSGVYFFERQGTRRVFNIALTGYDVSGTQGHWSTPVAANSMDGRLHAAGHALAVFRADAAFLSDHARWWMQNGNYPGRYESGVEIVPGDHFDAYVFFASSHLDEALPAPPMWRP